LLRSNGQFVLQPLVSATSGAVTSPEFGDAVEYKLLSNAVFDRELRSDFSLTLVCHDDGVPSLSSSRDLVVRVTDANDNPPRFERASYSGAVAEELPPGQPLVRLVASDLDIGDNGRVEFALCDFEMGPQTDGAKRTGMTSTVSRHPLVTVDRKTGLVSTSAALDFEGTNGRPTFELCVVAFDQGQPTPLSATATLNVTVIDVNDRAPMFSQQTYSFGTFENQPSDTEIGRVVATDPDSPPHNRYIEARRLFDYRCKCVTVVCRHRDARGYRPNMMQRFFLNGC
jgi:hypothetical protein